MSWTAIVPAAGVGSRLGLNHTPKILYPIGGRSILERLLPRLSLCSEIIFVVSPEAEGQIASYLPVGSARCTVQTKLNGTAHAVSIGLDCVQTEFTCVVWGDSVITSDDVINKSVRVVRDYGADVCIPVMMVDNPYIHLEREKGKISKILHRREGDLMPATGQSDIGMFFFRTKALRETLSLYLNPETVAGALTGEINFLPILPLFKNQCSVLAGDTDVIGINTLDDVRRAERFL